MDDDDIQSKISRLRANMETLAQADADCLLELHNLCRTLLDIHAEVPEAGLLYPPKIYEREGKAQPRVPIGDDRNWHSDFAPRLYCAGVNCRFTFNPRIREWAVCFDKSVSKVDASQIKNLYTTRLAEWVIRDYPAVKESVEERERTKKSQREYSERHTEKLEELRLKQLMAKAESKARMDEYTRSVDIVMKGCLVLGTFFVVSALIAVIT